MAYSISLFKTIKGVTPIKVGRRILVSGLFWQVLPTGHNYKDEARKIARRERERTGATLDVVFLRRHVDVVQAGFVVRGGRARKGTVSLAAVAADVLGPTFIAAFPLPDGRYALVSAIHDALVPDSDGVFDTEETKQRIRELWNSLSTDPNVSELQVFAPQELWPGGKPISLQDLLPGIKRKHRLRQRSVWTSTSITTLATWFVLAALAFAGYGLWRGYEAKVTREAQAQRALQLERLRSQTAVSGNDLALMRPWSSQPTIADFAATCVTAIGQVPITLDGWVLLNAQCNAKSTNATFARTDGRTVVGFAQAVNIWRPQVQVQFSIDGDLGTLQWPISMSPAGDEGLQPMNTRANSFMTWWQTRMVPFELVATTSTLAPGYTPPVDTSDPKLTQPHWKTASWSIKSTPRNPVQLLQGIEQDGVRLQEVELVFNADGKLNWSLKGELYGE
ncbi:hypothetical protein PT7_0329 [Pusillimonas sp. T7-7]|uniref:type 4b pilus protein PilO2 n=1 Tax=Pusillimonas sp. (strain T7-7) TaxID=1007105 RepID=UPI0002084C54|nr:type 4b pilus protein PilO2 [Pusillimonas sp. T7-7]AEC18869.1 hypothetical protein PT7_0329 [Pusillimonas sp. T7-7]